MWGADNLEKIGTEPNLSHTRDFLATCICSFKGVSVSLTVPSLRDKKLQGFRAGLQPDLLYVRNMSLLS